MYVPTTHTKEESNQLRSEKRKLFLATHSEDLERLGKLNKKPVELLGPHQKHKLGILMTEAEHLIYNEYHKNWQRKKTATIAGRSLALLIRARKRAEKQGVAFDITREWIIEKLKRGFCEVSNIPFVYSGPGPWVPSLDRIIPGGPYTMDNTRVVVWCYNTAKNAHTDDDVMRLARALVDIETKKQEILQQNES